MSKYTLYLLFSLFVIFGCGNNSTEKIQVFSKEEFIDMVDTISIAINPDLLGKYGRFHISDDNYLVGYNRFLHRIDVFNLDQRSFSHSIQLDYKGPNGIPSAGDVFKIGDEYIIRSNPFHYRISENGSVIGKITIRDSALIKDGYRSGMGGARIVNFRETSVDIERQCIFKQLYKFQEDIREAINIDSTAYFMCSIDLVNWTTDIIKLKYPKPYVESFPQAGYLGDGSMLRVGQLFVFNFPGGNEVYAYDTITKRLKVHNPVITNRSEMKIDISDYGNSYRKARFNGQRFSPRYLGMKYDALSNTYYRVHKTKARENIDDADFFLIKMDSNFNTIAQYNIGNLFYLFQIHDGYIYFPVKDVDKDALYNLKLCRIKCN